MHCLGPHGRIDKLLKLASPGLRSDAGCRLEAPAEQWLAEHGPEVVDQACGRAVRHVALYYFSLRSRVYRKKDRAERESVCACVCGSWGKQGAEYEVSRSESLRNRDYGLGGWGSEGLRLGARSLCGRLDVGGLCCIWFFLVTGNCVSNYFILWGILIIMAAKFGFSQSLKELRFLFCQTSEHSAAVRYATSSLLIRLPGYWRGDLVMQILEYRDAN